MKKNQGFQFIYASPGSQYVTGQLGGAPAMWSFAKYFIKAMGGEVTWNNGNWKCYRNEIVWVANLF